MTVCAPWAARYAHDPATATTTAEKRKDDSYPRIGGIGVTGIAVDLYGGFGPGLSSLLSDLANLARTRDISRGGAPRRLLHAWRTRISAAIARGVGRQLESAQRVGGPHPDAALVSPIPPGSCQHDTRADRAAGPGRPPASPTELPAGPAASPSPACPSTAVATPTGPSASDPGGPQGRAGPLAQPAAAAALALPADPPPAGGSAPRPSA